MLNELNVFFSNDLDILYLNLKENLFKNSKPFTKRLIIVYGPAMKAWLMLKMAQDPDLKLVFGIEFVYFNQAFEKLISIFNSSTPLTLPSPSELALVIEKTLFNYLNNYHLLRQEEKELWQPLLSYFKLADPFSFPIKLSFKFEKRLINLSHQLAKIFLNYSRFSGQLTKKWQEETICTHWQQALWKTLFGKKTGWSSLTQALEHPIQVNDLNIHFFSISFLSRAEFHYIEKISQYTPLFYYLISPCAVYWSDIRSDSESRYIQSFFEKQFGKFSPQVEQLEEILRDRNPLLANFGRMGREMVMQIEESSALCHAHYVLPDPIERSYDIALCENLFLCNTGAPLTLLNAIQADMLLMHCPQEEHPFNFIAEDHSIQLHCAPNKRREIEILYHNLLNLIHKDSTIEPRDIIVMAPQIQDYIPYIKSYFGHYKSLIDFQILDLGAESISEIVQSFLLLLKISACRWDVANLLQLFEQPSFQRKTQFSTTDHELMREWIEQTGIRWGDDSMHRNELLKRQHCRLGMVDETAVGTWDYGLSQLLLGLTHFLNEQSIFSLDVQPNAKIDFANTELLSKWMRLLHALRDDLAPLHDGTKMCVEDWSYYFKSLLETYFQADFNDSVSIDEWGSLNLQIELLQKIARTCPKELFSFNSIIVQFENMLSYAEVIYRENYLQTVRFCSLIPLRSIPAKVICLLGMQEEVFPRMQDFSSLNLASSTDKNDYMPSSIDYDRFLFLEALHSTQNHLIISYQGYNQQDHKEQSPSLVVEEIFIYLDRYYTIKGKPVSKMCVFNHPRDGFAKNYFLKDSKFYNFSLNDYCTAKVYYQQDKKLAHRFISNFSVQDFQLKEIFPNETCIDIKHLTEVARHPIKFHLNRVLEIYLEGSQDRLLKNEEELKISTLDKYILKRTGLKTTLPQVLRQAENEGKLPFGLFKTVAVNHLTEEIQLLHKRLSKEKITQEQICQIEFCRSVQEPIKISEKYWHFPSITLDFGEDHRLHIVGTIQHATPKGLFAFAKDNLEEIWKIWPQYLAYQYACKSCPDHFEKNLILSEKQHSKSPFFSDAEPYLKQFVHYYALCHQHISPLMPAWLNDILKKDTGGLQKNLNQIYEEGFGAFKSLDLQWIFNKQRLPHSQELLSCWEKEAEKLLADLHEQW